MKTGFTLSLILLMGLFQHSQGQPTDRYGGDKEACGRNYTIYYEMYKLKNYQEAIPFWQKTIAICPRFSLSLWKNGEKMYQEKIQKAPDSPVKEELIDSLLWIYDQRMLYFGDDARAGTGYVLGRKGLALLTYRKSAADQAYNLLKESMKIEGNASSPDVLLTFMQTSRYLYNEGILNAEDVLQDYEFALEIIDANLEEKPNDANFINAREGVEAHFTKSGAADCEALIAVYSKQLDENRSNKEWLAKISRQLKTTGCTDNEFYLHLAMAQFELEPSGSEAHSLAQMLIRSGDYILALPYLQKSIDLGVEDGEKAQVYYELSYIHFTQLKDYPKARSFAQKAIEIRPNWGEPYLLCGKIYIESRLTAFPEEFDQNTVLWVAIDQFTKAKTADPEVKDKAEELIKTYSVYLPKTETLFYYALKKGDPYEVGSWIKEKTTVKARD